MRELNFLNKNPINVELIKLSQIYQLLLEDRIIIYWLNCNDNYLYFSNRGYWTIL